MKKKKKTANRTIDKSPQRSFDFDDLPVSLQSFFAEQADGLRVFKKQYPRLFEVMFKPMDSERYRRFEARLVRTQQRLRKRQSR